MARIVRLTSEDLSRSPTAYRHLAFIRYNSDPIVPGRGSGIFLHASTGRPTLGCVSWAFPIWSPFSAGCAPKMHL